MKLTKRYLVLFFLTSIFSSQLVSAFDMETKVDKKSQERILITTDLEVDDMNGIILSLMYADQYDIAGIVWTAGMYHFSGDQGKHTLAEICPHYRCNAQNCENTVANAGELRSYRPADPTFLDRMIDICYKNDYKFLSLNSPNYPTPEYLRSITKVGNIEFEGDYRFDTDGSKWIEQCILDDDMRQLHIQHWGGINTTVRALYSIYNKYHDTADWDKILAKVVAKVRINGDGEDYCRKDSKIDEMFPGLQNDKRPFVSAYGQFFSAKTADHDVLKYYQGDYLCDAFKFNHGKLMSEFWLMAEGRAVFGEPLIFNYGLINYMDWSKSAELGWSPESLKGRPRYVFNPYDWMCCQFGCASYINLGLRTDVKNMNTRYVQVYFDELAARADWAIAGPEKTNHAPIITPGTRDFTAKAGKAITLTGSAKDPDGNPLHVKWWIPKKSSSYYKEGPNAPKPQGPMAFFAMANHKDNIVLDNNDKWTLTYTVPKDAKKGDKIVINMEVTDEAGRPMTRFAQNVITVK